MSSSKGLTFYVSASQLLDFEVSRLRMLAGGVLGCGIVGSAYAISILMHALQSEFGISQEDLTTVSSFGFVFQFFTLPGGFGVDIAGPRSVITIATCATAIGWALFALCFHGAISHSIAALTMFDIVLSAMTGYFDPACNLNNLFMFSLNRGLVILVQKTFMGLSTSLLSLTYISLFQERSNNDGNSNDNNNSTSSSSESSGNNNDSSTDGIVGYCVMFSFVVLLWGTIAALCIKEAPMMKLTRQKTYKKEGSFELVSEEEVKLMNLIDETSIEYCTEQDETRMNSNDERLTSSTTFNDANNSPREEEAAAAASHNNNDNNSASELSDALKAALIHHIPCDARIVTTAQLILIANLVYLSGASIAMLYVTPSRGTAVSVTIFAHLLTFGFFALPLLKKYVWYPSKGVRIIFPNSKIGDIFDRHQQQQDEERKISAGGINAGASNEGPKSELFMIALRTQSNFHEQDQHQQQREANNNSNSNDDEHAQLLIVSSGNKNQNVDEQQQQQSPHKQQMMNFPNMYRTRFFRALYTSIDLWIMFFCVASVWGSGATVISNTIQMYDSLSGQYNGDPGNNSTKNNSPPSSSNRSTMMALEPFYFESSTDTRNSITSVVHFGINDDDDNNNNDKLTSGAAPAPTKSTSKAASLTVSLMGVGSALGRVAVGYLDQKLLNPRRLSVTILLPLCPLLMVVSYLIPFVMPHDSPLLWFPFFLNAAGYGASWATVLLSMRQMVAVDVAANYMFLFLSGASSLIFGRAILGPVYDAERELQHAKEGHCLGIVCVSASLLAFAGACTFSVVLSVLVHYRWTKRNGLGMFESLPVHQPQRDCSNEEDEKEERGFDPTLAQH